MENGLVTEFGVNDRNQFTGTVAAQKFPVKFAGTTNEPSDVTVGGADAGTNTTNWEAEVLVGPGANSVEIRATEKNVTPGKVAQTTVRRANLTLAASPARAFSYDGNGSTESDGMRTYTWDAANRLKSITTGSKVTEFSYDGGNRWVKLVEKESNVVVGSREVIWEGASIAQLRLKDAAGAETERRTFYGGGEVRAVGTTNTALLETSDHLGNVRELLDSTGTVRARYDYDIYGKRTKVSGDLESDFGFTGHYEHSASSLTLAPFRAYDAVIGRWISRDPIEESGGLNLYGYVGGNVVNGIDPDGAMPEWLLNGKWDSPLEAVSNFAAGWGDSLSFGATNYVREQMGTNIVVNKCSNAYNNGVEAQIASDLLTLGASAGLKGLLKLKGGGRVAQAEAKAVIRNMAATQHHIHPLAGHPFGTARDLSSLFPTGGLPAVIHSAGWNLKRVQQGAIIPGTTRRGISAEHMSQHKRLWWAERIVGVNAALGPARLYSGVCN